MNKKLVLLTSAGLVLAGLALNQSQAFAYRGDPNVQGPNYSPERHEAMVKALETGDYEAWKELKAGRGRVSQIINKDNFAKFAQAYKLAKEGKTEEAAKIRAELGLGVGNGTCKANSGQYGMGMGKGYGRGANR